MVLESHVVAGASGKDGKRRIFPLDVPDAPSGEVRMFLMITL